MSNKNFKKITFLKKNFFFIRVLVLDSYLCLQTQKLYEEFLRLLTFIVIFPDISMNRRLNQVVQTNETDFKLPKATCVAIKNFIVRP